ncbi:MAG: hypothetical protein K6U03_07910 [Firmicutes bacterium]|nr:hypothetical protein [Bacillota bacterium]
MAEKQKGPSKLPFGMSPVTLAVAGLGLLAVAAVYLFPGLFGGGTEVAPGPITRPKSGKAVVTAPAGSTGPGAAKGKEKAEGKEEKGEPAVRDELSTFLVAFGRANPFASFEASASPGRAPSAATTASQQPLLADLRQRLESLRGEGTENQGGGGTAGTAGAAKEGERFTLTGIVRYESLALAVITEGARTHYVMPGEPLGKTGYVLKAIREDSVVIAAGEDEKVLALRRKSP